MKRTTFTVGVPPYCFTRMGPVLGTGDATKVFVKANRPGFGIRLQRGDVPARTSVPANFRHIQSTRPSLVIGQGLVEIASSEALLAALYAGGAWGSDVIVYARDVPNMDGTMMPWIDALKDADLFREGGGSDRIHILKGETSGEGPTWSFSVKPSKTPSLEVSFDHPNRGIGKQSFKLPLTQKAIIKELGDCRPIRLTKDLNVPERAALEGMAQLGTVLLFDEEGKPTEGVELRHSDEPARRMALDAIAVLSLLGAPVQGDIKVKGASLSAFRELAWHLGTADRTSLEYA